MTETFVVIRGYKDYQISNLGRVISNKNVDKPRFLKQSINNAGYLHVCLHGNQQKVFGIHRLIAMHFLPVPDDSTSLVVDHINQDKLDNRISNLRWITQKENLKNQTVFDVIKQLDDGRWNIHYSLENARISQDYDSQYDAIENLWMYQLLYNRSYDLI